MPEELVPKPYASMSTLDQTRDVHQHSPLLPYLHDTQHGLQRSEWIGGDFRMGGRQGSKHAGLTGVRLADDADIRDQLELQPGCELAAPFTLFSEERVPVCRGGIPRVPSAPQTPRYEHMLTGLLQIDGAGVPRGIHKCHDGAFRYADFHILAAGPMLPPTGAVPPIPRYETAPVPVSDQRLYRRIADYPDIASIPTVTSVRPSHGDELLPSTGDGTIPTVPASYLD